MIDVFFFKQKTAYEWRISDWSSDVCSSDLLGALGVLGPEGHGRHGEQRTGGRHLEVEMALLSGSHGVEGGGVPDGFGQAAAAARAVLAQAVLGDQVQDRKSVV